MPSSRPPVIVVGGGQSGLAAARALRELRMSTVILEASDRPTGSWPRYYDSLRVFSPAGYSSMPGMPFPGASDHYPSRDEVADYLEHYAAGLEVEIQTNTRVETSRSFRDIRRCWGSASRGLDRSRQARSNTSPPIRTCLTGTLWEPGYAAEAERSFLATSRTLDEALGSSDRSSSLGREHGSMRMGPSRRYLGPRAFGKLATSNDLQRVAMSDARGRKIEGSGRSIAGA